MKYKKYLLMFLVYLIGSIGTIDILQLKSATQRCSIKAMQLVNKKLFVGNYCFYFPVFIVYQGCYFYTA
ncbi:MAG: hypothetical protein RLZZ316_501 [Bacteroidota bacterium]